MFRKSIFNKDSIEHLSQEKINRIKSGDIDFILEKIDNPQQNLPLSERWSENDISYALEYLLEKVDIVDKKKVIGGILKLLAAVRDTSDMEEVLDRELVNDFSQELKKLRAVRRIGASYYPRTRWQARCKIRNLKYLFGPGLPRVDHSVASPVNQTNSAVQKTFTCIGSCFAVNIARALSRRNMGDILAMRYHDDTDPLNILLGILNSEQLHDRIGLGSQQYIVITLGFSENNKSTVENFDPRYGRLHNFLTPEAISMLLIKTCEKLKNINKNVKIFVTVSPVPISGSMSGFGAYQANVISKSIVRLGVAMAVESSRGLMEYFPSYEAVTQGFVAMGIGYSGGDDGGPSHVNSQIIDYVTGVFCKLYFPGEGQVELNTSSRLRIMETQVERPS